MKSALPFALALLSLSALASASDLHVGAGGSIQLAIAAAVDGDRVLVEAGTYHERIDFLGKAIEVIGLSGAALTILDADLNGTVVRFVNGEGPRSRLAGFTVARGAASGSTGGGILAPSGARPTIEDCRIVSNHGSYGAGVHGDAILVRCTIQQNTASTSHGGGLWGAPQLYDCVVANNSVTSGAGGGLYLTGGAAVLRGCWIEGNASVLGQGRGGGIYVDSSASASIEGCVLVGNFGAAGVFAGYGGGIFVEAAGTSVVRCTLVDNSLSGSSVAGGAIYGPAQVRDTIVSGNSLPQLASVAAVTYSDVEGGAPGTGNFDLAPLFVDAAAHDYHLMANSPCIDAGDPADARDANGSVVDVGAFSFDLPAPASFCLAGANSVGSGAQIGWAGSQSLAANDFELQVSAAPAGQFGAFFYGPAATQLPFGDGFRCVSASGLGLFRLQPLQVVGAGGSVSLPLDFQAPPASSGPGAIAAGSSWNFQFWYRDPAGPGGSAFNLSNALHAGFVN